MAWKDRHSVPSFSLWIFYIKMKNENLSLGFNINFLKIKCLTGKEYKNNKEIT